MLKENYCYCCSWLQYDSYSDNIVRVACDDDQAPILSDDLPTN